MSLLPSWPTVAAGLVIGAAAGAVGMHTWDASTIAGLKVDIANMKATAAQTVSVQSQAALKDFQTVAATINLSAQTGQQQFSALGTKLDTLAKAYKNAKPTVLSADCRPGTVRVQNIASRAAAIDQTLSGQLPGK
jgi:hypothetical protein